MQQSFACEAAAQTWLLSRTATANVDAVTNLANMEDSNCIQDEQLLDLTAQTSSAADEQTLRKHDIPMID